MIPDFGEIYGIEATPELVLELRAARPAGILLQRRNIEDPDQVRELIEALVREVGAPLEFAVRHEGGAVTPFVRGVTAFPGLEALEAAADPRLAREMGRAMGRELVSMGITIDLVSSSGPMARELALGLRGVGIQAGVGPVVRGDRRDPDPGEAGELARAVARAALRIERDPRGILPLAPGRRVGLLVPRLGDVADRLPVPDDLRATAALLRPGVGASVAVLEVAVEPDPESIRMAAEWMGDQEAGVQLLFDAGRFPGQRRLLEAVSAACPSLAVATIGASADRACVPEGAAIVSPSGFQACQLRAALEVIFAPRASGTKRK